MSLNTVEVAVLQDKRRDGRSKIPALTGIRGVAACWVVLFHLYEVAQNLAPLPPRAAMPVFRSGFLGVDLFFILSGFVLALTYTKSLQTLSLGAVGRFAIGRVFRVLPLHWFVLLFVALAVCLAPHSYWGPGPFNAKGLIASLLLVQGWIGLPIAWNYPTWSLSAEWLSYIGFVLLVGLSARVRTWRTALLLAVACLGLLILALLKMHSATLDHAERLGLLRCFCELGGGVMLCRLWSSAKISARSADRLFVGGALLVGVAILVRPAELAAVVGFAALVIACAAASPLSQRAFANRPVHWLGEISYSIYLTHALILNFALMLARSSMIGNMGAPAGLAVLGVSVICIFPIAWMTWRFIEVPGQALGRILTKRARPPGRVPGVV